MIYEEIESPFSGGKAHLKRKVNELSFRKSRFEILEHYYQCEDTDAEFTTAEIDRVNLNQVYNQYRDKFGLPFPDQIKAIREKYDVSASKMSEILGLGTNTYRLYEQGEVPSVGNGRLIMAAEDPFEFKKFLAVSKDIVGEKQYHKICSKIDSIIEEDKKSEFFNHEIKSLFTKLVPDKETGYRLPNLEKICHMIMFFSANAVTWSTKLNKLLFYSDFLAFKNSGQGISGLGYQAFKYGPVPSKYWKLYDIISEGELLHREHVEEYGHPGSYFVPKLTFNELLFDEFELGIMHVVSERFKWHSAVEIENVSHKELAWIENEKGQKNISYQDYGFTIKAV